MKTVLLFIVVLCAVSAQTISAQNISPSYNLDELNWWGTVYTDAQIRAVLGAPNEFNHQISERGNLFIYEFNTNGDISDIVEYQDEDGLLFVLMTPKFSLYNGLLKVGTNIDDFRANIKGVMDLDSETSNIYNFYGPGSTSKTETYLRLVINTNGDITHIILVNPI